MAAIASALRLGQRATIRGRRFLNLHEYQSAQILAAGGVTVPRGIAATSVEECVKAAEQLKGDEVVIKSQILAGGRGLGTFTNGFQGGVHVIPKSKTEEYAQKMIGQTLVTKQSGPEGKPVNTVLMAEKMDLVNEMYFAILLDRAFGGPVVIACAEGGTSIEDLAEKYPEKIKKVPIDIVAGMTDQQASEIVDALEISGNKAAAIEQVKALYGVFRDSDCTMVEVNPLAEDSNGTLIAADAKLGFDDNTAFRQKDIFAQRDHSQEDPRDVAAEKWDLNYIGLDGSIGCMVNGAGLAMATMDIIQMHGGSPANFLDVGGSAKKEQIVEAFKIVTTDPNVKAILVNIFGGIMKCDVIAAGIVAGVEEVGLQIPLIVRLEYRLSWPIAAPCAAQQLRTSSRDTIMQFAASLSQKAQSMCAASLDTSNGNYRSNKAASDGAQSSSTAQADAAATEAPARRRSTLYRCARGIGAAAVFIGCLAGAAIHRAKQIKVEAVHAQMADMAKAREAGEALAAAGDARGARELLGEAVGRWTSHERTVRHAIFARTQIGHSGDDENAPERLAAAFEDAQHVASHLRAAYGSLLLEDGRPREAVTHLTAVCPSIWFFARRIAPGEEHLRGEVSWLRCYADLMDARKALGEHEEVGVLERDVVTHSTAWLRRKRDRRPIARAEAFIEGAASAEDAKKGARLLARRRHDLEARWPRDAPRLRRGWGSGAGPPPKNQLRRERNRKRVATLRYLSKLSVMDAAERAQTARDYARALGKARAARRDIDGVVRAYVDAPDALQRTRLLALLRETAAAATAKALPADEVSNVETTAENKDAAAEWSAGVALAAMLRAASPENRPALETDKAAAPKDAVDASAAYLALADAFFGEKGAAAAAAAAAATAAAEATPKVETEPVTDEPVSTETDEAEEPVTRAFGRLVAAEGAQYVGVVSEVHAKGWAWIQHEVARLEEDQRRCGLAIAPVAGPPPGFLSRFDVIHVVAQHRAAVVQRDQRTGRRPGLVPPRKRATGQKTRRQRLRERNAKIYGGLFIFVVALVRGLSLLKDTRRKTADGYSKRKPKLTWRAYGESLLRDTLEALRLCLADLLQKLRRSIKKADASIGAGAVVLRAVDTITSIAQPQDESDESDGEESTAASSGDELAKAIKKPQKQQSGSKLRRRAPQQKPKTSTKEEVVVEKAPAKAPEPSFADSDDDWAASTEWLPVPKGGRVVGEGPRIPEVSPRHHVVTPPLAPPSRGGSPPQGRKEGLVVQSLLDQRLSQQPKEEPAKCPSVTSTSSSGSSEKKPEPRKKKVVSPRTSPRDSPRRRSQQARQHRKAPPLPRLDSGGSLARAVAAGALGDASDTPPPTGYGIWDDAAAAAAAAASASTRRPPARQISQDGLDEALRTQVEYYFSVANLCKDVYLRGCMDGQGFVPLDHVCTFKRLRDLCDDPLVVRRAVESSDRLNLVRFTDESSGANVWKVRTVDQPERWVLAASQP